MAMTDGITSMAGCTGLQHKHHSIPMRIASPSISAIMTMSRSMLQSPAHTRTYHPSPFYSPSPSRDPAAYITAGYQALSHRTSSPPTKRNRGDVRRLLGRLPKRRHRDNTRQPARPPQSPAAGGPFPRPCYPFTINAHSSHFTSHLIRLNPPFSPPPPDSSLNSSLYSSLPIKTYLTPAQSTRIRSAIYLPPPRSVLFYFSTIKEDGPYE